MVAPRLGSVAASVRKGLVLNLSRGDSPIESEQSAVCVRAVSGSAGRPAIGGRDRPVKLAMEFAQIRVGPFVNLGIELR